MKRSNVLERTLTLMCAVALMLSLFNSGGATFAFAEELSQEDVVTTQAQDGSDEQATEAAEMAGEQAITRADEAEPAVDQEQVDEVVEESSAEAPAAEAAEERAGEAVDESQPKQLLGAPILRAAQDNVITQIEALLENEDVPVSDVSQWQTFRLNADFKLPNGQVHEGDTTTITLPNELRFAETSSFKIMDGGGNVIANATVNGANKQLTLTYTDYPETHSDVEGSFYFYVRVDRDVLEEEQDIPLRFDVDGQVVVGANEGGSVHFIGFPDPRPFEIAKSGWKTNANDERTLSYQLVVNTAGNAMDGAYVTDTLNSPGIAYDRSSLIIQRGTWEKIKGDWNLVNAQDVTSEYDVTWSDDDASFTIDLGDISEQDGFLIRYEAISSYDLADGEIVENSAQFGGRDYTGPVIENRVRFLVAGGTAEGYVYRIDIVKTDSQDGSALAGAVFDVVRVASGQVVSTLTTDAAGRASIGGLLNDRYQLVEKVAPTGYKLLPDPIAVTPDMFNAERVATVDVENDLETVEVPVTKAWVGPAGASATVRLLADGEQVDTATLTADGGWAHTFSGLAKYDVADGHEIAYTIEEDPVEGYEATVTGDAASGFTVTNEWTEEPEEPAKEEPTKEEPAKEAKKRLGTPKTGDDGRLVAYAVATALSGVGAAYLWVFRRKRGEATR